MTPVSQDTQDKRATFGAYLRAVRVRRGLSLRKAAVQLGTGAPRLSRLETGGSSARPTPALFDALALLYRRPVDEVIAAADGQVEPGVDEPDVVWSYTRASGWARTTKFQLEPNGRPPDGEEHWETTGYGAAEMHIGSEDGVHFFVHSAGRGPNAEHFEYLVWLHFGGSGLPIAVPTLPDLMALLAELKPLTGPAYSSVVPAPGGWNVRGQRVAAFAFTPEGRSIALVAGNGESEYALGEEMGAAVG